MTAFQKFDPHAFLEHERLAPDSLQLSQLSQLSRATPLKNEILGAASKVLYQPDIGAAAAKSIEIQRDPPTVEHRLDQLGKNQNLTPTPAKVAKVAKDDNNFRNFRSPPSVFDVQAADTLPAIEAEASRDRFEERAAILEFDESLSRAEAEATARREMVAGHDTGPYASALAALRAHCPAYVDPADWQRAIEDDRRFITQWGEQAEALGWTSIDLFGLHSPPEKPAPNYRRLSCYDQTGLIWLLRGRSVVELTTTAATLRCPSGATLKFYRRSEPALAGTANVAPATETGNVMQPTPPIGGVMQPTLQIAKGATA